MGNGQAINEQLRKALALHRAGDLDKAGELYAAILELSPKHAGALALLGTVDIQRGRYEQGIGLIEASLRIDANQPVALNTCGVALKELGRYEEARSNYEKALRLRPDYAEAHNNLGILFQELKRYEEAIASYEKAISLKPELAVVHYNLGNALAGLERYGDALTSYDNALAINPGLAEAYNDRGTVLVRLQRIGDGIDCYRKALAMNPNSAPVHRNLGTALQRVGRYEEALACYASALALKSDYGEAHNDRATVLQEMGRIDEALAGYDAAIGLRPDYVEAYTNRASLLRNLARYPEALSDYQKALAVDPDFDFLFGSCIHTRMQMCAWDDIEGDFRRLVEKIEAGQRASNPFAVLAIPSSPAQQLRCAQLYAETLAPGLKEFAAPRRSKRHGRTRIGYFSGSLHEHPTSQLIVELFERHDRANFEVIGFSFGASPRDAMRTRLETAFDELLDVRDLSDEQIAGTAGEREIDIAVDLMGYTREARPRIFALRPAPVQVNYLGYPGTLGAPWMDYIIADSTVIPEEHRSYYSEKIAYLPHSYQANQSRRAKQVRAFDRAELGLPDRGFIFCCHNNHYKITPDVFDIWMRLLHEVPDSVLWLLECHAVAEHNLTREAARRGVSPQRLVFARRLPIADHLARLAAADLFLDTFHYNAHTTASDALWSGVPLVTCLGQGFAARVGASLLRALGLQELIAPSSSQYEALALRLATHPEELSAIRQELSLNRASHPLFDAQLFARHIEQAYTHMWRRHEEGLGPEHFCVTP